MKIGFSGVQSTGKTTLINLMQKDPDFANYTFVTEIVRTLVAQGIPINEKGTAETQILVLGEHMKNLLKDNVVLDRCLLDGVVYTIHTLNNLKNGHEFTWLKEYASNLLDHFIHRYDIIFYLQPEFDIVDDGVRSISTQYRNETNELFKKIIERIGDSVKIVSLSGSVERRMLQIKNAIDHRKRELSLDQG